MRERQRVDFLPPPPSASGEQGRRQVGSSPRLRPTNTRRASSEAASNITPPPAIQRARGVVSTTPPAPHDRDGHHSGVEASSPPSPTVHNRPDRGGCARTRAHRRATQPAGAGTKVKATPLVPPTTITHGNTGFCSPPPDLSRATMVPSQMMTALPLSPSLLSPKEDEAVEPKGTPPPPPDPAVDDGGSAASGGPHDDASDDFRVVEGRGGQLTLPRCDAASGLGGDDAMPPMRLTPTAAQRNNNPFVIFWTTSSRTESTPLPIHPRPANTLRKIVEDCFDEMFGDITNCPADDTRFWLRAIFRERARLVDSMVSEVQGETVRLTTIESRLDTIESRLDLVLQRLPRPLDELSERLVVLEHAVESLQEVRPILDDLRHRQLSQIRGDIDQVREGVDELKPEFCQGLDDVHLRVDDILTKMGTPVLS
jgi:hypothetical protein